jgi:hypothetical protein
VGLSRSKILECLNAARVGFCLELCSMYFQTLLTLSLINGIGKAFASFQKEKKIKTKTTQKN